MSGMAENPIVSPRRHANVPGFTLVEILIVVLILALLAVISLSVGRSLQAKAYQTAALNSIRQVATANASYSMDNNGDINVLLKAGDSRGTGDTVSNSFWGRLIPYLFDGADTSTQSALKTDLTLRLNALFGTDNCLNMTKTFQKGATIHQDDSELPVPFAFNEYIYQDDEYLKTQNFRDAAQILYFCYGSEFFNEEDAQNYAPVPTGSQPRTNNIDWFSNKTAVFTFLDGHVEILPPSIPDRRFKDPDSP